MTESEYQEFLEKLITEDPRVTWEIIPIGCIRDIKDVQDGFATSENPEVYCRDFIKFFKHRIVRYQKQRQQAETSRVHYLHQNPQPLTRKLREKLGYTPQIVYRTLEQLDISHQYRQYSEGFLKHRYMTDQWIIKWLEKQQHIEKDV